MSYLVDLPVVQNLGMQGEFFRVKVTFPVYRVKTDTVDNLVEQEKTPVGIRSIILEMRAEDLPMHGPHDHVLHFNVGRELREQFGPFCKRCGNTLTRDATCSNSGCPYHNFLQNAEIPEE